MREFGGLVGSGDVGRGQHLPSVLDHLGGAAEVDLLRGEQADAAVAVFGVVPSDLGSPGGT
ncbi:MAG: hypothetical protein J4G03_08325 [Gemmatimonadetes bacterium]|nr:hypothetical protein [Gemmatimonadota bacterium]